MMGGTWHVRHNDGELEYCGEEDKVVVEKLKGGV